jgi:hypothetical protein
MTNPVQTSPSVRWCVTFQLVNGDWEWITVEAKHPAGAKQQVHERIGDRIDAWATPTRTDKERSLVHVQANQFGGERRLRSRPLGRKLP